MTLLEFCLQRLTGAYKNKEDLKKALDEQDLFYRFRKAGNGTPSDLEKKAVEAQLLEKLKEKNNEDK